LLESQTWPTAPEQVAVFTGIRSRWSSIPFLAACDTSMLVLSALYQLLRSLLVPRLVLVTENLALRQQLLVLRRSTKRPRLRSRDRLFWVALSQLWQNWRSILVIVKPETVIKWHRQGFKVLLALEV
jgi:hypothetical protein